MTNYPITDPAEIAKLPPAAYRTVTGVDVLKLDTGMFYLSDQTRWGAAGIADTHKGIAGRLVLEDEGLAVALEENRKLALELGYAKAQRGRAVELLRRASDWIFHSYGTNNIVLETNDFLTEQEQPCQRCGGEGLVAKPDAPGIRTRWYEDCPDCKLSDDQ